MLSYFFLPALSYFQLSYYFKASIVFDELVVNLIMDYTYTAHEVIFSCCFQDFLQLVYFWSI